MGSHDPLEAMETTLEIHWSYWCDPLELLVRPLGCTPRCCQVQGLVATLCITYCVPSIFSCIYASFLTILCAGNIYKAYDNLFGCRFVLPSCTTLLVAY
ncbi:unnamed protein product [Malus baccata var. baccata]